MPGTTLVVINEKGEKREALGHFDPACGAELYLIGPRCNHEVIDEGQKNDNVDMHPTVDIHRLEDIQNAEDAVLCLPQK